MTTEAKQVAVMREAWRVGGLSCGLVAAMVVVSRLPLRSSTALAIGILMALLNVIVVMATLMHLRHAAAWVRWSVWLTALLVAMLLLIPALTVHNTHSAAITPVLAHEEGGR